MAFMFYVIVMLYEVWKNFIDNNFHTTVITETGYVTTYNIWVITLGDVFLIFLAHGYLLYFLTEGKKREYKKSIKRLV